MTKNMGNIDRALRLAVVLAIGVAFLMGKLSGTPAIILGVVAVAFFLTSLVGTCPIYSVLGLSSRGKS
jgi:ABC-type phosphate transport system permease subunit